MSTSAKFNAMYNFKYIIIQYNLLTFSVRPFGKCERHNYAVYQYAVCQVQENRRRSKEIDTGKLNRLLK